MHVHTEKATTGNKKLRWTFPFVKQQKKKS